MSDDAQDSSGIGPRPQDRASGPRAPRVPPGGGPNPPRGGVMGIVTAEEYRAELKKRDAEIAASLLAEAKYWDEQRTMATERYAEALEACKKVGLSNTLIAQVVGKTEPAIRMFLRRRIQT